MRLTYFTYSLSLCQTITQKKTQPTGTLLGMMILIECTAATESLKLGTLGGIDKITVATFNKSVNETCFTIN